MHSAHNGISENVEEAIEKSRANAAQTAVLLTDKHNSPNNNREKKAKDAAKHTMGEIKGVSDFDNCCCCCCELAPTKYVFFKCKVSGT